MKLFYCVYCGVVIALSEHVQGAEIRCPACKAEALFLPVMEGAE